VFENTANSTYHALQLEARKRYTRGYQFTLAYTWSHALDDVSDVFPIAGAPILPQDSFNLPLDRGNREPEAGIQDRVFQRVEQGELRFADSHARECGVRVSDGDSESGPYHSVRVEVFFLTRFFEVYSEVLGSRSAA
jgi:hypothetical protein